MKDVGTGRIVGPEDFAGIAIQADEARCFFFGDGDVTVVDTVGGIHEQEVSDGGDGAAAHVVLRHTEFAHHIEFPKNVGFVFVFVRFLFERSVVFIIVEALGIQARNFSTAGDIPQAITIDQRSTADTLIRPIMDSPRRKLLTAVLPQKFTC